MPLTAPKRSEAIIVRLSPEEKERLVRAAITRDQRFGQLARRFINEALDTEPDATRDDHTAQ